MDANGPQYVGFWARFLAFLIDSIVMCLVLAPLAWLMWGEGASAALMDPSNTVSNVLQLALSIAVFLGAWIVTSTDPGKKIVSARIVSAKTLGKPSTTQFVVRYLGYYLSLICFGLGFLWIAFDARKQGWHDKLAGTLVIRDAG
jgi:uncharacterized RDD family membrane protein YckC